MLDDSRIVRCLKLGAVGLVAGLLISTEPIGSIRVFGPALPGAILGALLAAYFAMSKVLDVPRSLVVLVGSMLAFTVAELGAAGFFLVTSGDFATSHPQTAPTIPTMVVGGTIGAAFMGIVVLPLIPDRQSPLARQIIICAAMGAFFGGVGYALCLAGDYQVPLQAADWPGLAPLFIVWPAGVAAALGWVMG